MSYHHYHKYPNLIKDITFLNSSNKVWVSDITYIWLIEEQKFSYLFLITDMYSRKIIGYYLSIDLSRKGAIISLKMAINNTSFEELENCIHHSDRGVQYCCHDYTNLLKKYNIKISMTETGNPLDNAIAERINKTIKEEFTNDKTLIFTNFAQGKKEIKEIINFYNNDRPHRSIDWLTPELAHCGTGILKRQWKSYYKGKKLINFNEECCMIS